MNSAYRTRIKVCGLTREADLDAAASAGIDALGFVLYRPSARYVSPARAGELARQLPPWITPVLLFVNADAELIEQALREVPNATLQFHGDETPGQCTGWGRPFLRAARLPAGDAPTDAGPAFDLLKFASEFQSAQAILLDAHVEGYGGGGKTFNWSQLPTNVNAHLVLSGGLTPANVTDGILQVRPRCRTLAVDVSSGVEVSKGIKSADLIHQFCLAVRRADAELSR